MGKMRNVLDLLEILELIAGAITDYEFCNVTRRNAPQPYRYDKPSYQ
jgi:hypothetical protein